MVTKRVDAYKIYKEQGDIIFARLLEVDEMGEIMYMYMCVGQGEGQNEQEWWTENIKMAEGDSGQKAILRSSYHDTENGEVTAFLLLY